jgi:hypothetical protein
VDVEAEGSVSAKKRLLWYCAAPKGTASLHPGDPEAAETSATEGSASSSSGSSSSSSSSGSGRGFRRLYVLDPASLRNSSASITAYMSKLLLNRDAEDSVRSDSRVSSYTCRYIYIYIYMYIYRVHRLSLYVMSV